MSRIASALAASLLWIGALWLIDRIRFGKIELTGAWAEWIESGEDRCFSIGTIKRRFLTNRYMFDGTNYHNDGRPFCYWRTTMSSFSHDKSEYIYVFATKDVKSLQTTSYGYGVVNLAADDNRQVPTGGFYMYSIGSNASLQRDHTLSRVDPKSLPKPGANAASFLEETFPKEWALLNNVAID